MEERSCAGAHGLDWGPGEGCVVLLYPPRLGREPVTPLVRVDTNVWPNVPVASMLEVSR